MRRLIRRFLAVALLAFASYARATSLHLLAPADRTTLRGGSFAELRWSATQLPVSAEEWEAFLSIDGGKYYAFRVTPHLEIGLRRFTFIVPNVDTRDARILIRVGDEVRELHFEARGSFSIVHDPNAEPLFPRLLQFGRGEAARDGDPAVLAWADGARNGAEVTQRSSTTVPPHSFEHHGTVTSAEADADAPAASWFEAPSIASTHSSARHKHARKAAPLPISVDLLLVCRRRNI
jgi:hypothetical protein